ncbi:DNA-binding LacI/PurR family transcriptional regulator [Erwinia toletana]|uniref:DNA-binding LacI/PurR family transcriptional regulator n=1 Tax=Winslowiella toletana TaxID=92490 RepID=A0ABS4P472_9GAMM|nr:LacI family DNA-binding transcriptional regulator [Winslowiella toletana]MBP2167436.1 DNA-binding LacI/PurR family transcriptional regulator [Winslowiella toletana]
MTSRSVTLEDVAKLAGVSYQTVSRVLNHSAKVSAATREKVSAAMLQLNYVPNRVAQQLAGKATRSIGLATTDLMLLAPAQIASAIQHRAAALGYQLVIAMADLPGFPSAQAAVNDLLAQRVDGLLLNLPLQNDEALALDKLTGQLPCLFMDVASDATVNRCQFSASEGARQGVEHLYALGHRQIALINGPLTSVSAMQRFQAWQRALAGYQLAPHSVHQGDWSAQSGYQAVRSLLPDNLPTALLVANDQMALGAMRALHQHGIRIPQQISVVGYDDTAESAWYQPPLTTIRQDIRLLGQQSVDCLVAAMQSQQGEQLAPLATELVVRETTASVDQGADIREVADQLASLAQQLRRLKIKP